VTKLRETQLALRRERAFDRAMNTDVAELADAAILRQLVAQCCSATGPGRISVAFACGAEVATASVGEAPGAASSPLGCLAKLFTATLVRRTAERGQLALDGHVAPLLGADLAALHGVTLRHLLEHTHGLDDSRLEAPRHDEGFIDRDELLRRVGALARFASPGVAYSYGHAGAWLAAAILERVQARLFAALVRGELLEPLGIDGVWLDMAAARLCAATGAELALTAEQLARFGLHALTQGSSLAAEPITALPGWHPLERGVCLGWKYAGAGWFGHQSAWPGASSYLRVQPQRGLAVTVVASAQSAALAALRVFGARLPELFESMTRRLDGELMDEVSGTYEQAARMVRIAATRRGLQARTWRRNDRGEQHGAPACASLVPARGMLFARPATEHLPFVELVNRADGARWLWNGRCVLRRVR
jgi:CubicO group peptidase (beta-lactamase class C family)